MSCRDKTCRGVGFNSQKQKLLVDIKNSRENGGSIMKKNRLNEDTSDFMLPDYTAITQSNLKLIRSP